MGEDVASLRQGLPDRKRSAYCPLTAFSLFGCVAEREKPLEGFKMASRGFWRVLKGFITAIVFVKNLGACQADIFVRGFRQKYSGAYFLLGDFGNGKMR